MAQPRARVYARESGLAEALRLVSASLDELESLAVDDRAADVSDATEGRTTSSAIVTNSDMDMAACALSASVLQYGDGVSESGAMTANLRGGRSKPPRGSSSHGSGASLGDERAAVSGTKRGAGSGGDGTFATRDAAVKAEVCRSLSEFLTRAGHGSLPLPAELSWKTKSPDDQWLGVSLVFQVMGSLRCQAAPAFANFCESETGSSSSSPTRGGSRPRQAQCSLAEQQNSFLCGLLQPPCGANASDGIDIHSEAQRFARFFIAAHCSDFPKSLWQQALTLARTVACVCTDPVVVAESPGSPRLDVILLRCLLLYTVAPTAPTLMSTFRNPAVRTLTESAVCADRGVVPPPVVEDVLRRALAVASAVEGIPSLGPLSTPEPELVGVVLSNVFWCWASAPYSAAWTHYYMP